MSIQVLQYIDVSLHQRPWKDTPPCCLLNYFLGCCACQEDDESGGLSGQERDGGPQEQDVQELARKNNISLLDQHTELKKIAEGQ